MFPLPVANGKGRPTSLAGAQFGGSGRTPWLGAAGGLGAPGGARCWGHSEGTSEEDVLGGGTQPSGMGVRGLGLRGTCEVGT